jgi:single-strand DNA-binding protein
MPYLNKVMLIGNIGKDPETKVTPSGKKRASFSLATSRRYRDASGETKEQTDWHNIVGWGKIADIIEQLGVHKGMTLYVEGTLTYRSWDDQNGQKRYATDINMDAFQLLTPRIQNSGNYTPNYNRHQTAAAPQAPASMPPQESEDDLPF